jgi:uncharacterized protein YbjT (DUF2867 family)
MTKVLVLGAGGQIARWAIDMMARDSAIKLTLFARDASRLRRTAPKGATVIEGDVKDAKALGAALAGQDIVYANLAGDVDHQAVAIVKAMDFDGVKRLIFITSLGIYGELPPKFNAFNQAEIGPALKIYRRAADAIEASDLDYTVIRPAWLTDEDEVDYETTGRHDMFKGTEVSRKSVAELVADLIANPGKGSRDSLGVSKPGTDGDKPAFY